MFIFPLLYKRIANLGNSFRYRGHSYRDRIVPSYTQEILNKKLSVSEKQFADKVEHSCSFEHEYTRCIKKISHK